MMRFTVASLMLVFAAAAGFPDSVQVEQKPGFDFSKLHTYSFAWEVYPEKYQNHPVADGAPVDPAVERAVDKVLSKRGFERISSGRPNFLVNCTGFVQDELSFEGEHRKVAEGVAWIGEGRGPSSQGFQTAFHRIEIIDSHTNEVVWLGWDTLVARDELARRRKLEKWTRKIIRRFPPE